MRKSIRNIWITSLFFFILSFGSCWIGVSYDKRNKLYPETNWVSYDLAIGSVYGKRWERIGNGLLFISLVIGVVATFIRYRTNQDPEDSILDLNSNK